MPLSVPKPMIIKPNPGSLVITMRLDACDMRAMWLAREIRERIKSGFSLTGPPVTTRAIEQRVRELTADLPIAKIVRVETA